MGHPRKRKAKERIIKLESMRAGYHDPTLLKIYKKVLDPTLPAPHKNGNSPTTLATKVKNRRNKTNISKD